VEFLRGLISRSMSNNNGMVFNHVNGINTPSRKVSLNLNKSFNNNIVVQGLSANNEKIVNKYTQQYLNAGFKLNDARKAARDQLDLEKKMVSKKKRKTRKQRKKTNN
jgi:hypothetical protein